MAIRMRDLVINFIPSVEQRQAGVASVTKCPISCCKPWSTQSVIAIESGTEPNDAEYLDLRAKLRARLDSMNEAAL